MVKYLQKKKLDSKNHFTMAKKKGSAKKSKQKAPAGAVEKTDPNENATKSLEDTVEAPPDELIPSEGINSDEDRIKVQIHTILSLMVVHRWHCHNVI